ncbi:substrate-binding domain-containing protein [Thermomonospora echinospora]|uniref:substrate-binding domain-containing protein n=1 Tax=Thermomonospora echinospora TaxID=1992 RepID=UPI00190E84D4|nr:substrate-binding domain-containing protein [Thermomonospora echinospora]
MPPGLRGARLPVSAVAVLGLVLVVAVGCYAVEASADCRGNADVTLQVAAAPDIAPALVRAIDRFNETQGAAEDTCVRAVVRPTDPAAMTVLLSGQGAAEGVERRPDVWIPDSSLWTFLVSTSPRQGRPFQVRGTSLARNPIILGLPQGLVDGLKSRGVSVDPSWNLLLSSVPGAPGGNGDAQAVPPELVRLQIPDPSRSSVGMGALVIARQLLAGRPGQEEVFTSLVRTARENLVPSVDAEFRSLGNRGRSRHPVLLVPEQAVFAHNGTRPAERLIALYPREGTPSLDYPFTVTTGDAVRVKAAGLLERALRVQAAADEFLEAGFRSPDGRVTQGFGPFTGLSPRPPRQLPLPPPAAVRQIMQTWARLTLSVRLLVLFDVSGSMRQEVAPGVTRLQATARVGQSGLPLLADDSELGIWLFSTKLEDEQDWRVVVPVGPLGQRIGSVTRRQLILSELGRIQPKRNGGTGLYDSVLAAFRWMKDGHKPEMVNTVLVFTDGRNDDDDSPSLEETVTALREEYDPARPVQIIIQGYGPDVSVAELRRLTEVTNGLVQIARAPEESKRLLLEAMSRRVCSPRC